MRRDMFQQKNHNTNMLLVGAFASDIENVFEHHLKTTLDIIEVNLTFMQSDEH